MTIPANQHQPQAQYDSDGNIVLSTNSHSAPIKEEKSSLPLIPLIHAEPQASGGSEPVWETIEEEFSPAHAGDVVQEERREVRTKFQNMSGLINNLATQVTEEGSSQVNDTLASSQELLRDTGASAKRLGQHFWAFLSAPLWISEKKENQEVSRGMLFVWDVFRFGGTFAGIFVTLFTLLNAQSFWQISVSAIMPFIEPPSLELNIGTPIPHAQASSDFQGLLSYLPDVGPPQNMLIIPKLNISAPLVQPPTEALLEQDWAQVEKDIQESLLHGVVHYPGTAKAGQAGNFFLTGHSSNYGWIKSAYNSIFARLHQLEVGDEYWVYWNGDRHRYVVRSKKEVSPSDVSVLDQPPDERIGTLMTCTPIGTTLRRLIVQSQEVDPDTLEPLKVGEKTERAPVPYAAQMLPI